MFLAVLCSLLWAAALHAAVTIKDDTGTELTLGQPAQRVIALYGAFNELALAMGLDKKLVGRTAADENIAALRDLPAVGTHMRPNPELIISLKPDVVIQLLGRQDAESFGQGLRNLGVPVVMFRLDSFADLFSVVERMGVLLGVSERAADLTEHYKKRLNTVFSAIQYVPRIPVFYEVRYPNLLGAGKDSIVNDIIFYAGGSNVAASSGKIVRINEEELIRLNPEAYIIQQGPMNPDPPLLENRPHFAGLQANRAGRVLVVDELTFSRPGPHAVEAVENLAKWLHPQVVFKK